MRDVPCGSSPDMDGDRTGGAALEGVGGLGADAQADPVGLAGGRGTEAVDVAEVAAAVRADGREGAPARADAGLELDDLARDRDVAAEEVTGEADEAARGDRARVGVDPAARRRADAGAAVRGQEERVAREGEPDRARRACGEPDPDAAGAVRADRAARRGPGGRAGLGASGGVGGRGGAAVAREWRSRGADVRATTTVRRPQTGCQARRPRRRCVRSSSRPASGLPPAVRRPRSDRPRRTSETVVVRRSGSVTVAGAPSARVVPIDSLPAASETTARSS